MSGSFLQLLFNRKFTSDVRMKAAFADVSSVVPGLTVWPLLAQLWPGEGAPSLFPPSQCFGGPGAPPATAGKVAQTFRSHSEETPAKAKRGNC